MSIRSIRKPFSVVSLSVAILLFTGIFQILAAQTLPATERRKIEKLINDIEAAKDVEFVRNGKVYTAAVAAKFLRRKWEANDSEVKSARDFIEKIADTSATTGKPYRIRLKDGTEVKSKDHLLTELRKLEKITPE